MKPNLKMKTSRTTIAIFLAMVIVLSGFNLGFTEAVELDLPIQTALDIMNTSADSTLRSRIKDLKASLLISQEQIKTWDRKVIEVHAINDEALIRLQQEIKEIDLVRIAQLTTTLEKTKDRYRPVFAAYNPLNTILGSAKLKLAKVAVQLARADIELKQSSLRKAKELKANKVRAIRTTLSQNDAFKVQIKTAKSSAGTQ